MQLFSRAEEIFIENLKETAEREGGLTLSDTLAVAAEAQGLDSDRDALRIILDTILMDRGLAPGSDEYGLWLERITKRIVTLRKPTRKGASLAPTEKGAVSPVPFDRTQKVEVELEGDRGGSFYLTDPNSPQAAGRARYVNE